MRILLPVFLLLLTANTLHAQQALTKDSSVFSRYGWNYEPREVNTHILNRFCKDSVVQNAGSKTLYTYNAQQQTTAVLIQDKASAKDTFLNFIRTLYTYTPSGRYDTVTLQFSTYFESGVLKDAQQYRYQYDANNNLVRTAIYSWATWSNNWEPSGENIYFNNSQGRPDSMYSHYSYDTSISIYTYYPSGKIYQAAHYWQNGIRWFNYSSTSYYDSANYVSRDSTVSLTYAKGTDSLFTTEVVSNTHYYNGDNLEDERYTYHYINDGTSSGTTLYKTYYFYSNCSSVLPVSFLSFSASGQVDDAVLRWQTGGAVNASFYLVQRSTDGVHFTTVGSVGAVGSNQAYTYTDVNVLRLLSAPKLYYRLAETDKSGNVEYSNVVSLPVSPGKTFLAILPNPVLSTLALYSSQAVNNATVVITDMQGKRVYTAKQSLAKGGTLVIDASGFAKGMYLVTVQSASYKGQLKMIKE